MTEVEQHEYLAQMEEIKLRLDSMRTMSNIPQLPPAVATESTYLQIRKVLELIAMASLVTNRRALKSIRSSQRKLGKMWNGGKILRMVENVNPDFYPSPFVEVPSVRLGVKAELRPLTRGFLERREFEVLYAKCNSILHADNPMGSNADYWSLRMEAPDWIGKIMRLLTLHEIRLSGHKDFYLFHMREERDGRPHIYRCEVAQRPPRGAASDVL